MSPLRKYLTRTPKPRAHRRATAHPIDRHHSLPAPHAHTIPPVSLIVR